MNKKHIALIFIIIKAPRVNVKTKKQKQKRMFRLIKTTLISLTTIKT